MQPPQLAHTFSHLLLAHWRQFRRVDLTFHPRLTVVTGANGSGKTTIVNILARHFGWSQTLIERRGLPGTTAADIERLLAEEPDLRDELEALREPGLVAPPMMPGWHERPIGTLTVDTDVRSSLTVNEPSDDANGPSAPVQLLIKPGISIAGLNIPSHRPLSVHETVQALPTQFSATRQILTDYITQVTARLQGAPNQQGRSPLLSMKEALIAAAIYGEGNTSVLPNPEARAVLEGFQDVLRRLLPDSLGFERIYIAAPDVIMATGSGHFPIDAASGGIMSIMEIAWQIFLHSRTEATFVVCFDEPENHLHPELQRTILPRLMSAFPHVQFIVATHNPFIVSSVPDSSVYVLKFDDDRTVNSILLDPVNRAGTANQVLRDVLGLSSTLPLWAEEQLRRIVARHSTQLTRRSLARMRAELREIGLEDAIPSAVVEAVRQARAPDDPIE